jgi:hypothetical protein
MRFLSVEISDSDDLIGEISLDVIDQCHRCRLVKEPEPALA